MLTLQPGPKLSYQSAPWEPTLDITEDAHRHLFEPLALDAGVTLADLFGLVRACEPLQDIYHDTWVREMAANADLGPVSDTDPDPRNKLEYLELYQVWGFNSETREMTQSQRWDLHGVGPVLAEDYPDMRKGAGERIEWSLSMAVLRSLLSLPVKVRQEVPVCESAPYVKDSGKTLYTATQPTIVLGQLLQCVFDGLSVHGSPESLESTIEMIQERMVDVREHFQQLTDSELENVAPMLSMGGMDDLFDPNKHAGCVLLFETIGGRNEFDIRQALHPVDDHELVGSFFEERFGDEVVVEAAYRGLTARQFRQLFAEIEFPAEGEAPETEPGVAG